MAVLGTWRGSKARVGAVASIILTLLLLSFAASQSRFGDRLWDSISLSATTGQQEGAETPKLNATFDLLRDGERLSLTDLECTAFFPNAFTEIGLAKGRGRIGYAPHVHDDQHGFVRARICNGGLYIVTKGKDVWHRMGAILHQINRAIITAPDPSAIPNIEFTFLVNDHPANSVWSFARSTNESDVNDTWIMPDFGYWSWPEPKIGSIQDVRERIAEVEPRTWVEKEDRAVWRGSVRWNEALRGKLLNAVAGKEWSDVEKLDWKTNALGMEGFCKYRYLIYTEGVTYSGRLLYFQLCRSVIITPPMRWHTTLSTLMQSSGPDQTFVPVKDDWSDLESKIEYLRANPEEAERIANNTVRIFRDHYLAPAVETCYWRKLFSAWSEATDPVGVLSLKERGVRWESYALMGKMDWEATA